MKRAVILIMLIVGAYNLNAQVKLRTIKGNLYRESQPPKRFHLLIDLTDPIFYLYYYNDLRLIVKYGTEKTQEIKQDTIPIYSGAPLPPNKVYDFAINSLPQDVTTCTVIDLLYRATISDFFQNSKVLRGNKE